MKLKQFYRPVAIVLISLVAACAPEDKTDNLPTEPRDKFIGSWTCKENSKVFQQSTYSISIKKSTTNANQILCSNFYQLGAANITMMVLDGSNFTIPRQTVSGQIITGSGTAKSDTYINFSFTADDGAQTDVVTAVLSK